VTSVDLRVLAIRDKESGREKRKRTKGGKGRREKKSKS
jgi:hypothetical protein